MTDNLWIRKRRAEHKEQNRRVIDKFKKAFNENVQKVLYHYSQTSNLKGILNSNLFWASNITKLNDSSEYDYGTNLAKEFIKGRNYDSDFTNLLIKVIEEYQNLSTDLFVLSFSRNGDSLPLWKMYSDDDCKGYNLGFEFHDIDFGDCRCHGNVIYSLDKQREILFELVDEFEIYYKNSKTIKDSISRNFFNEWHWDVLVSYFTLFKHSGFRCEEEYRVVYYVTDKNLVKNCPKPHIEVPTYSNGNYPFELPFCEIWVGPKNEKSEIEIQTEFTKNVNIIRSDIPLRK